LGTVRMNQDKRDFDKEAAEWDEKPERAKMAQDVARAIREAVAFTGDMDVLDFGCGTGLLTLQIQPFVKSITGVYTSRGMMEVLRKKIESQNLSNVKTRFLDREKRDGLSGSFHLVVSSMTLHHVPEIGPLLRQFHGVLRPGGHLALADLDEEGGRFHADNTEVFHFGFDRAALRRAFEEAGFSDIRDLTAAEVEKTRPDIGTRKFSIFLVTGRK
jgi:2-polyprenyl-3-methyl-5-hydroxy-6-metoxy-1,4-benzoquinol methylase